jgi:uncharacterized Zn finger protein (UPF0148 family)
MEAENINNPQSPALQQGAVMRSCVSCGEEFLSKYKKAIFCPYCEDEEFEDDGRDEDFYQEQREMELGQRAANCKCGAWQMAKNGEVIHVADCCCGAE